MKINFSHLLNSNWNMQLKYDVYVPNFVNNSLAPVVLLHSMVETRKTWLHTAPDIMKNTARKVYTIDARNHGDSPWDDEYSIDVMVNDLDEFLIQNKINKVILVGHSIGGKVAIEFALRKPEKVEKLIIEEGTPRNFIEGGGKSLPILFNIAKDVMSNLPENLSKDELIAFFKNLFAPFINAFKITEELLWKYDFDLVPLKWDGNTFKLHLNIDVIANAAINNKLNQNHIGTFQGDVLLLYGTQSQFKIGSDPLFLQYLPRTKKLEFKNGGHFLHQTYPKEFSQEVVNFINRGAILNAKY